MNYIGKDFINYGCGLELDPEVAWSKVHKSVRKNINKTKKLGVVKIERCLGLTSEFEALRKIWYYPEDPNFPITLDGGAIMYMAYAEGELVGGVILLPVGTHLFLNNLTASDKGKKLSIQDYLLWYVVNDLKASGYSYIDVGVSYRLNLYRFFSRWATFKYPVIFNPPKDLSNSIIFAYTKCLLDVSTTKINEEILEHFLGTDYTIVPEVNYASEIISNASDRSLALSNLKHEFPLRFGAAVKGVVISPEILWEKYSCYDHYKTEYIKKVICSSYIIYEENKAYVDSTFAREDLTVMHNFCVFSLLFEDKSAAEKLSTLYSRFGIQSVWKDNVITLPCHAETTTSDLEYMYAVYRGYLNLCSEWESTGVKGTLKR